LLRQDNAFLRLTEKAYALGLIDEELYQIFKQEKMIIHDTLNVLRAGHNNAQLLKLFGTIECNEEALRAHAPVDLSARAVKAIHAEIVYQPYIEREQKEVEKNNQYKQMIIPDDFDYADMPGLSKELQQKLKKHKPQTIAQAALIPGITPAALSLLIFKVRVATDNIRKRKEVGCSSDTVF
jgi:tRNA uridine 5-carboxymethylaminomethyl modification enzyme